MEATAGHTDHAAIHPVGAKFLPALFLQVEDIKKVADYVSQLRRVGQGHGASLPAGCRFPAVLCCAARCCAVLCLQLCSSCDATLALCDVLCEVN